MVNVPIPAPQELGVMDEVPTRIERFDVPTRDCFQINPNNIKNQRDGFKMHYNQV